MYKLAIFDMDGTLTPQRPSSTAPFCRELLPGVREKLEELRAARVHLAVVTNQGGARRGRVPRLTVGAVLAQLRWLKQELGIEEVRFATKPPRKKPAPAMLLELMDTFGISPDETLFVGDAETDREAAKRAGCRFAWAEDFFKDK